MTLLRVADELRVSRSRRAASLGITAVTKLLPLALIAVAFARWTKCERETWADGQQSGFKLSLWQQAVETHRNSTLSSDSEAAARCSGAKFSHRASERSPLASVLCRRALVVVALFF